MARDLTPLFFPRSVAVIGASNRPDSLAGAVLRNLVAGGFPGNLVAVHPRETAIGSVPVHPTTDALPAIPDLAVWGIASDRLAGELPRLAARGTRAHIVLSAGFGETDAAGKAAEEALARACRSHGAVLLGPNGMGLHVVQPGYRLDASFSRARPDPGTIAVLSQSGSIAEWILLRLAERGVGAGFAASLGNLADLDVPDLLEGVARHLPEIRQVLLYLETLPDAERLRNAVRSLPADGRLWVVRGGRSDDGRRAAAGHTGALAAEPELGAALMASLGAIEPASLTEAVDALEACERLPGPPAAVARRERPLRVAVTTNAGGPAVLAVDALGPEADVPLLSATLRDGLARDLPAGAITANPVDALATASAERLGEVLRALTASDEIDALLPVFMNPVMTDATAVAEAMARAMDPAVKPASVAWMAGPEADAGERTLRQAGFPIYPDPHRAARALVAWGARNIRGEPVWPERLEAEGSPEAPAAAPTTERPPSWGSPEALERALAAPSLPLPASIRARTAGDARAAARTLGFPLMFKIESASSPHKGKADLLERVPDAAGLDDAIARLEARAPADGAWLVQSRIPAGTEVYVGYLRHPHLGSFLSLGRGGSGVESGDPPGWLALPAPQSLARGFVRGPWVPEELRRAGEPALARVGLLLERLAGFAADERAAMAEVNPAIWDPEAGVLWLVDCRWQVLPPSR
jgi:acetyltransferase